VIRARPEGHVEYWLNGYEILEYLRGPDAPAMGRIFLEYDGGAVTYQTVHHDIFDYDNPPAPILAAREAPEALPEPRPGGASE
jgi:hypothetical protein